MSLRPLLTPDSHATLSASRVDADGQVKNWLAQVEATKIARDRARRLLRDEAGSRRQVDEAEAQHDLAVKTWEAATARMELLTRVLGEVDKGTTAPLAIDSPRDGLLRNIIAFPEQTFPAGRTAVRDRQPGSRVGARPGAGGRPGGGRSGIRGTSRPTDGRDRVRHPVTLGRLSRPRRRTPWPRPSIGISRWPTRTVAGFRVSESPSRCG